MNRNSFNYRAKNEETQDFYTGFNVEEKSFNKGEIISLGNFGTNKVALIKNGVLYLCTSNENDQRRIIEYYEKGNIFSESFFPKLENKLYYIFAKTKCTIQYIEYEDFIMYCNKYKNLFSTIQSNIKKNLLHIDVLSQSTLRDKLNCYFKYMVSQSNSHSFELSMPLSDFCDYISADRSAMMREIKKMNEKNIIKSNKRKITIISN